MKTALLCFAAGVVALAFPGRLNVQSTSCNANTIAVGGAECGIGSGALNATTGIGNIAVGYLRLFSTAPATIILPSATRRYTCTPRTRIALSASVP